MSARTLSNTRVIVAGAGMAGLTAARELEARGADVILIEARSRVGGRVQTWRRGFHGRQHAEAGADILDGGQRALRKLAGDLKLDTTTIFKNGFGYYGPNRGGRLDIQRLESHWQEMNKPFAKALREYQRAGERWDSDTAVKLYPKSVAERLSETRAPEWVHARVRGLRGLFLADPDELSVLALIEFLADMQSDYEQGDEGDPLRIAGGNDCVATLVAKHLDQPPQFRTILRRIRQTKRGVVASVETTSGLAEIRGDYIVVTLPATLARDVVFEPALPETQWTAISRLRYGHATRLVIQFATRFWNKKDRPNAFGTDQPYGAVWDGNEEQGSRTGILSFLAGGRASAELQGIVKSDGLEGLRKRLKWLGTPSKILASKMITWEKDPWARGGYAYFDPSYDPRWRQWLKRPAGRIFFAGEHTSARWLGYVNGAVESGQRAAEEIEAWTPSSAAR